jgi:hypothetical protein
MQYQANRIRNVRHEWPAERSFTGEGAVAASKGGADAGSCCLTAVLDQ